MSETQTYIVDGTLKHNGKTYKHGETFDTSAIPEAERDFEVAKLRHFGTLKLESEVKAAEELQAEQDRLKAENAAKDQEIAALKEQLNRAMTRGGRNAGFTTTNQ